MCPLRATAQRVGSRVLQELHTLPTTTPHGTMAVSRALHTGSLDGFRALANLWIVLFHTLCFMVNFMCRHEYDAIAEVSDSGH